MEGVTSTSSITLPIPKRVFAGHVRVSQEENDDPPLLSETDDQVAELLFSIYFSRFRFSL